MATILKRIVLIITLLLIVNCCADISVTADQTSLYNYKEIVDQDSSVGITGEQNDSTWIENNIVAILSFVVALGALIYSIYIGTQTNKMNKSINSPSCKVKIDAKGARLDLRVKNVGTGIMVFKSISYVINDSNAPSIMAESNETNKQKGIRELRQLVNWVKKDTETLSCEDVIDANLSPNTEHHLLQCTFNDWGKYIDTWEKLSKVTVVIEYSSILDPKDVKKTVKNLDDEYEIFKIAVGVTEKDDLKDEKFKLKAFKKE